MSWCLKGLPPDGHLLNFELHEDSRVTGHRIRMNSASLYRRSANENAAAAACRLFTIREPIFDRISRANFSAPRMVTGVIRSIGFAARPAISDLEMSGDGCAHLKEYKSVKGYQAYRLIHAYFVSCTSAEARRRKASTRLPPCKGVCHFFCATFACTPACT